jgi:thioredoxin reductase (NADPH)
MLTTDDVRAVPLFSSLPSKDLERLAATSADLHLTAGEFAVPEGGERALFAVLSGVIEVVKTFDGVERRLGWRKPGSIFGEVPLALGSPFPGGYRASEPSRVMRVEAREYYILSASSAEFATKIGALARERLGGLQAVAAEQPKVRLTMIGDRSDAAFSDLRRFLERNQVSFDWIPTDSPDVEVRWGGKLPESGQYPVARCIDGAILRRPSAREVAELVGLQTSPRNAEYDTMIVGGGPSGLAAAVYGASEGLKTIVVEREAPGGQAGTSSRIENYLGFPNGVSGDELASRALQQARRLGAEILVTRAVRRIEPASLEAVLDGDERIRARTLILATGVAWRRVAIDGADKLIGKGVFYGASRSEAHGLHGTDVHLVGAGNSAGQAAIHFAAHARSVTLVVRGDSLEKSMSLYLVEQLRRQSNIHVLLGAEIKSAHGAANLEAIDIVDVATQQVRHVKSGGLFIFVGADAETHWLPPEIARDSRGYVLTGDDVAKAGRWTGDRDPLLLETSVPGVFACGDVRLSPVKRVAAAVGEGSMAIAFVHQFLQKTATRGAAGRPRARQSDVANEVSQSGIAATKTASTL